jgi:hypothetical protein
VPGNTIGGLTASPDGRSVAFNLSVGRGAGGRGGAAAQATAGIYIINVENGQLTRVPSPPQNNTGGGRGGRGGGGIDQELLGILSGRQYQYTVTRDSPIQQSRPQNFYGPMVVMQNERSASDAEMFPAGFKALGLGKVIGVPTYGAVIGTGSYTLLDGSTIRTPGSGVWL